MRKIYFLKHKNYRKAFILTPILLLVFGFYSNATVTISPAPSGTNISADIAQNGGGNYTPIGAIGVSESVNKDLANGTFILKAPAGWIFQQSGVTLAGESGTILYPDNTTITISLTSLTPSSTESFNIIGVAVMAVDGANVPSSGNITFDATNSSADQTVSGLNDATTLGSLSQTIGAMTKLVVTLPGQTFTDGTTVTGSGNTGTVTNQTVGTSFNIAKITATDQFFNVVTSYAGDKTLAYSGPATNGTAGGFAPSYTTSVNFTSGQSTTNLATTLYKAESVTITVTDGGSYGTASSTLTIGAKPVTVTPDAGQTKTYGSSDPIFTYTSSGLLGSDAITGSMSRSAGETVGTYTFNIGTLTAGTNYSLTVAATPTFSITAPTSVTWTGATSTDWGIESNWSATYVPTSSTDVIIPAGLGSYPEITSGSAVCNNLTIQSNSGSTGSLIVKGTGTFSALGTVDVERYIPSTNWHIVSSPVSGQGLAAFSADNSIGVYTTPDPDEYDLASYNEPDDTWSFVQLGGSGDFGIATGYSMHRTGADKVTFSGSGIYTGPQSVGVTCGSTTNGWNCIGNPYTSAIDAASFLTANAALIDNNFEWIYVWDQSLDDYDQITTGEIALGQGFFVNANEGGGNISFSSSMQTTGGDFKSSEIPWPTIKLIAQAEELSNVTTINFNNEMTRGLDPGFDGGKLKGNPDIALYTRLLDDNGIDFAIQALPEITTEALRIPVGIDFVSGGEMSFMVETTAFPADAQVYIEDLQAETTTLLNAEGAKYTVTLPAETNGTGRFNLLVTKNATGIKTVTENLFNVYTSSNTITINGPATSDTEFSLYSIDGKRWMSRRAGNINQNTIDASGFPAGIYMLNIRHQGNQTTKKLVLTK